MTIRKTTPNDTAELIELFGKLDQETSFMLMEPGERELPIEKQMEIINELSNPKSGVLFAAIEKKVIVGFLGGRRGTANRNKHSIHITMGVLTTYWGKGIGRQLLQTFIEWGIKNQLHRIELTVMEHNSRALSLYKKTGFGIEGIKQDSLKINSRYVNEYHMAKLI